MDPAQPRTFLYPGTIIVLDRAGQISTVLGSCVAVCLWDPVSLVGGMNHYLLPFWNGEGLPTPRYGNIAVERLVEAMAKRGAKISRMTAKVFGGAALTGDTTGIFCLGERNVATAYSELERLGIAVLAAHVGGDKGRKVIFDTANGAVYVSRGTTAK